ncbi:MAG: hypothetical protein EOS22_04780 [Mesorhizobium sp.]|uniref:hypothetical protein n=1 Tax=Mesorhizobium sp. TaxID=1871066 RepID=UPI000FE78744|nr:hypothetical protein [Mesorhizobium sp.]RWD31339.1 MAG: hypothetical protein EOS22_04780 [Mesorhizobium sp.]TJW70747.1 MAG: hypothetical protein E5V29_03285 [Mesorhizobium sp.]
MPLKADQKILSTKIKLFKITTIIPERYGYKDVAIQWFVYDRKHPVAPYQDMIADYRPGDSCSEAWVDELFTADEAEKFVGYLKEGDIGCRHVVDEVNLPASGNLFPVQAVCFGGPSGRYDPRWDEKYVLPFVVQGFYDLRAHEPLPGVMRSRDHGDAFVESRLIFTPEGKFIRAPDLEKNRGLHL